MNNQRLSIVVCNASGNITIFVLTPVRKSDYVNIASKLLDLPYIEAEQVAFVTSVQADGDIHGSMDMSGLEFCGNASRSFALFLAKKKGIVGQSIIKVLVSGEDKPIDVLVDTENDLAEICMPIPTKKEVLQNQECELLNGKKLVEFEGISHIILEDIRGDRRTFNSIRKSFMEYKNPPALGVMFYNTNSKHMTPVVYVRDVDSTYFEGSCASGTTALCLAMTESEPDGVYTYTINQPVGMLIAKIEKKDNEVKKITIKRKISFGEIKDIYIFNKEHLG